MSHSAVPVTNSGCGYTIVTHVLPPETTTTAQPGQDPPSNSPLQRFLKGEPKALGTFQIVTGLHTLLLGIGLRTHTKPTFSFLMIWFWVSLLYIAAGSLAVSASNSLNKCKVTASLVMNVFSVIAAGLAIILLSLDLSLNSQCYSYRYSYSYSCSDEGLTSAIEGVLLVFTIVQFFVSIRISVFGCTSVCSNEPVVNVTVVANPGNPFPQQPASSNQQVNMTVVPNPGNFNSMVNPFPQQPVPSNQQVNMTMVPNPGYFNSMVNPFPQQPAPNNKQVNMAVVANPGNFNSSGNPYPQHPAPSNQQVNMAMVPNPGNFNSVVNPYPQQPAPSNQQWMYTASGVSLSSPPMENPPVYSPPEHTEVKVNQLEVKMSHSAVPVTNSGCGYTIVTHVLPPETPTTAQPGQDTPSNSPLQRFLKGEPKALGTFQIVTGLHTLLLGIGLRTHTVSRFSFFMIWFWGSLLYIAAGSLAVSASNSLNKCKVTASLVMNVFSAITAGISIIQLSLDLASGFRCYRCSDGGLADGIGGVLLVFTIVQFFVSIRISVFGCKSGCTNEPVVNVTVVANPGNPFPQQPAPSNQQVNMTMVPNPGNFNSMVNPFPQQPAPSNQQVNMAVVANPGNVNPLVNPYPQQPAPSNQQVNMAMVPNPGNFNSVVNPYPQEPAPSNQQGMYTASGFSLSSPPMENPLVYSPPEHTEVKGQLEN
ncbi:uncharacterized protein [Hoplias malabaricus]|uniref:uncharacterized protein n=1 Tax=Hoplias malabaricus TaxID=27720 RepID=UPI003462E106